MPDPRENAAAAEGGRNEITPTIRVLHAGSRGWAVWDDGAEESAIYATKDQAIHFARQLAVEQAEEREVETRPEREPSLYDQADRATGEERRRLLKLAAEGGCG